MIAQVYISHDPQDEHLAKELSALLWRVGLLSIRSMNREPEAISRSERVTYAIRNSECFVPIVTANGSVSRTICQEIGYARGLERLIIPLQEDGAELPFLISHLRPVTFTEFEEAEAILVRVLRDLTRLEWLKVVCPACSEEMTQYLTPQQEVDSAILHGSTLETICTYCERNISLDPRTFRPGA